MILTTVDAPWYVASTSLTSFPGTPLLRRHQYTRYLGTQSYAFFPNLRRWRINPCALLCFSCSCCMINIASVVPFPELNPNCMLLTLISFLSLRSTIVSNIFVPCSNTLMPLKFPYSSGYPFCLYMVTISHFFHSFGICSSSQTLFSISCIVSTPLSPRCLISSIGRPEHPAAFPFFILSVAFFSSSLDISWTGPSTAGTSPSCFLAFSTFNRLLKYSLYLSLIFTSSVSISLFGLLIAFTSPMSLLDLALYFATL